ncbi:carboxymuconolactone decarboxylase family protein [Streptomyces sp. NBC_01762]|uniref:carboxymuconolactone decarboxylase family protein n=1 Tax=unclassified Streptomyces TaxID=2593676 RepID=UPI002DDBFD52|nr:MULTISPECIES: carboxymuconolactone decarboxylase family protein [unclassified Streptomyces]WSC44731.1 carboxymuconolactone decarboxylase family protein [Streptomyces sp. NBC_01762]WSD24318.1 carboxymuconolactone decarboxylase family protein [Streptomyces sp. NBC_01751]
MPAPAFPDHTLESAPGAARRSMEAVVNKQGHLPAAVGRLATSPQLLDGFLKISAIFESTTLDPLSREVLIMTIATRNDCHVCVAMHTAKLTALGADADLIAALRTERPLPAERLEAVRQFTLAVIATAGAVDDAALQDFLAHGYTPQNALEVVLGIGAYTMSTLANRMTGAPIDPQLAEFAPAPM